MGDPPKLAGFFLSHQDQFALSADATMFAQDICLDLMPVGGNSSSKPSFAAELLGDQQSGELARQILDSICQRGGNRRPRFSAALLCNAIGRVAGALATTGLAAYEILRDKEKGHICRLHKVPTQGLHRFFNGYLQVIPKCDRDYWSRSHAFVRTQDVWRISMPTALGGSSGLKRTIAKLAKLNRLSSEFSTTELENPAGLPANLAPRYFAETDFVKAKVTSKYGWDTRDYTISRWTEFYFCYKQLKFRWVQACIREHIVDQINALFRKHGMEAQIAVRGLPTAAEILSIRQSVVDGQTSFEDALERSRVT